MAKVLTISQPNDRSHFGADPLHRSPSQSTLLLQNPSSYAGSSPDLRTKYAQFDYDTRHSASVPSSAPSSPRLAQLDFSNQPSYLSTPSSSLSLDEPCPSEDEELSFPSYDEIDGNDLSTEIQDVEPPPSPAEPFVPRPSKPGPPTLEIGENKSILPASVTRNVPPGPSPAAGDDTAIRIEPTRHVDYLSHNWKEEDIWSSWRHIVGKRKAYSNSTRLENASWRTWAKAKYGLQTVSPERLNWLKDHDVTWLYGPLQTGNSRPLDPNATPPTSQLLSRSNSFGLKKPILKKRSLSELMLQRSISSATLMKQATDALRAQKPGTRTLQRPSLRERGFSELTASSISTTPSADSFDVAPSKSTSGLQTPCTKKHIHFNNKVEQCIAINKSGNGRDNYRCAIHDDSSSDEETLMMKPVANPKRTPPGTRRNSFSNDNKTIAMLPSTTLNYRGDTPEPAKQKSKQQSSFWNPQAKLSPSPSQETIRPSTPSTNFLLDDEDDELDTDWQPSAGRRASIYPLRSDLPTDNENEVESEQSGLRRTPSGMFMPYEEDEDEVVDAGLLGKVIDTVNTAKDIAHVIWNVGWRR